MVVKVLEKNVKGPDFESPFGHKADGVAARRGRTMYTSPSTLEGRGWW